VAAGEGPASTPAGEAVPEISDRRRRLAILTAICVLVLVALAVGSWALRDSPSGRRTRTVGAPQTSTRPPSVPTSRPGGATSPGTTPTTHAGPAGPTLPTRTPTTRRSRSGARSFTMLFAGDLLPHGPVNRIAAQSGQATREAYDYAPMLAAMKPYISAADLALCHMETPVAPNQAQITTYPVFGAPVGLVKSIRDTGYDGCSTASNHSIDKGKAGVLATVAAFNAQGLGHTGTYVSAHDATRIQMYDVKGVKVAHLSYAYGFNGIPIPADAPYAVHQIDVPRILAEAKQAREAGAQLVVLSLHWGNEYQPAPNAQQVAIAPALTASPDIDLIVGHHVHVVQPIVSEHGKFVVFGMGNQLSNQTQDLRRDGLTVLVTVTRRIDGRYAATAVRCIPTYVDHPSLHVYPSSAAMAASTPPVLRGQLDASFARTMAAVNSRGVTPGVTAYDPAHP
jgi:poly-gamma-glutamate capsule biosynthesis protein CapA/YwtB (metallophosphatase superfamily)